jgi:four helix bundle protein
MIQQGRLSVALRNRTKKFASGCIQLFIKLPKQREEVHVLGKQLLRSGTSVAAHAREASRARSEAEFCSKLEGALGEADESQLWLELLQEDCAIRDERLPLLHREAGELMAIFITMVNRTKNKNSQKQK